MKEKITTENREYKSDVFSMLMQVPEYALDVYNALNDSDYDDPGLVEMKTLDECISLTIRNDSLVDFFAKNKAEVIKNMTIDMTYERRLEFTAKEYMEQGMERGEQIKLINQVIKKVNKNMALSVIADELEEEVETIRPMYDVVIANPGKNAEDIFFIMHKE